MTEFDDLEDNGVREAAYTAGCDPINHWPSRRYLPDGFARAAEHLGSGLAWFGFWIAVGAASLAYAWASR